MKVKTYCFPFGNIRIWNKKEHRLPRYIPHANPMVSLEISRKDAAMALLDLREFKKTMNKNVIFVIKK